MLDLPLTNMAEPVDMLKRERGSVKRKLTTFKNYLQKFNEDSTLNDVQLLEFNLRGDNAKPLLDMFENVQGRLENILEDEQLEEAYEKREEFEAEYFPLLAQFEFFKRLYTDKISLGGNTVRSAQVSDSSSGSLIRLPAIDLPKFSGKYEEWLEFRGKFESMIHNNDGLTEVQKFHYLKASLIQTAGQIISSLDFSAQNYTTAWNAVCKRFEKPKVLLHNHLRALHELPFVTAESAVQIRILVDGASKHLHCLKSLNEPVEYWDTLLLFHLCKKLDKSLIRDWDLSSSKNNNKPTLDSFFEFLEVRAEFLESQVNRDRKLNINGKKCLVIKKGYTCWYCSKDHSIFKCEEFLGLDPKERIKNIKLKGMCANCFKKGHLATDCKSKYVCHKCSAKHNL